MDRGKKPSIEETVLSERKKGNVVFQALPGQFMTVSLDEFVKQPVDGLLYDLNRLEEVVLTFIADPKWVNDFAVAQVIRKLKSQLASARREMMAKDKVLQRARGALIEVSPCQHPECQQVQREYVDWAIKHIDAVLTKETS